MSARRASWPGRAQQRLAKSLREAAEGFPRSGEEGERAVHDARKELKRSASLSRLFAPLVGQAAAADTLAAVNRARRAIGLARDLDVLPGALARVRCDKGALEILLAAIERERGQARGAHADIDVEGLTAGLKTAAASVERWTPGDDATAELTASLTQTYRSARRRGRVAFATGESDDLHDFRGRVVDLGMQLAVFEPAWPTLVVAQTAELHKLRVSLGDHNDLSVLAEFVSACSELPPESARSVAAAVLARRKPLERKSRAQYGRLFAERPGAFERRIAAYLAHPQKGPKG